MKQAFTMKFVVGLITGMTILLSSCSKNEESNAHQEIFLTDYQKRVLSSLTHEDLPPETILMLLRRAAEKNPEVRRILSK